MSDFHSLLSVFRDATSSSSRTTGVASAPGPSRGVVVGGGEPNRIDAAPNTALPVPVARDVASSEKNAQSLDPTSDWPELGA